jgi:hypothetical protein
VWQASDDLIPGACEYLRLYSKGERKSQTELEPQSVDLELGDDLQLGGSVSSQSPYKRKRKTGDGSRGEGCN